MFGIRRADQGEILLIGNGKDDPPIRPLKEIALVVIVKPRRHDMAAAHQPHAFLAVQPQLAVDHVARPGTGGIHQHPRADHLPRVAACDHHRPDTVPHLGRDHLAMGQDRGPPRLGIAGVQHDQTAVLDPAVGIFIGLREPILQRRAFGRSLERQRRGRGQDLAPTQRVIQEQPQPDQPGGPAPLHPRHQPGKQPRGRRVALEPHVGVVGQHEAHRPADMRHRRQQRLALHQRLTHQPELEIFQIAQPAVEKLRRRRRSRPRQIALFCQQHRQAAPGRIARDPAPVDAAPDDQQVMHLVCRSCPGDLHDPAPSPGLVRLSAQTLPKRSETRNRFSRWPPKFSFSGKTNKNRPFVRSLFAIA